MIVQHWYPWFVQTVYHWKG